LSISSQKYGIGIRDLRSGIRKNLFRIPDPGVIKAPDPQHCVIQWNGSADPEHWVYRIQNHFCAVVCFWAEVFHLEAIRWDRPRFLSKSFLGRHFFRNCFNVLLSKNKPVMGLCQKVNIFLKSDKNN
jgi:hypothetical protein